MTHSLYTDPGAIELANEGNDVTLMRTQIENYPIAGQADLDELALAAREAKTRLDFLAAALKSYTAPLRAQEQEHRERYRPALDAYDGVLAAIKARIGKHAQETRALATAAQTQAAQAFQAGGTQAGALALAQAPPAPVLAGVSTRPVWTYEVINDDMVPREYCRPDFAKITAAVRAGERVIPGVRIWLDEQVAVRK